MSAPSSATPPPTAGTQAAARPTVFIGLGGAATLVLQKLRQRLVESAPEDGLPRPSRSDCDGVAPVSGLSEYPPVGRPAGPSGEKDGPAARPTIAPSQPNEGSRKCFKFLAIDTDRAGLQQAQEGENGAALSPAETLHLPLRKPAEYRQSSDEILSWLSRRWLYNIPRSLRTDGLRPLGRLVFVDHRAAIAERLRRLLQGAPPRVFIIASIDGGAGGGMLIDAAYAVRQQLDQLKLSADCFCGVMLHGTLAGNPANDLRRANAYATLTELNHYMRGDAAFRAGPVEVLPVGDVSEPPFRDAYLVQLGDELTPGDFERSLRSVAEYLYLNASGGAAALDRFRRESRAEHTAEAAVRLRGFSLYAARANKHAVARQEAERFCRRLIQDWSGDDIDESSARSRLQPPALALEQLTERVRSLADQALGGNAEAHFRTVILSEAKLAPPHDRLDGRFGGVLRRVHAVLGTPMANSDQPNDAGRLEPRLAGGAKKLAATIGGALIDSLEALVEQPLARLPAALAGVGLYQQHLRELRQAAEQALECDRAQAQAVWVRLQRGNLPAERFWFSRLVTTDSAVEAGLLAYCQALLRVIVGKHLILCLHEMTAMLAALHERLQMLRQSLRHLAAEFAEATAHAEQGDEGELNAALIARLDERLNSERFLSERNLSESGLLRLAGDPQSCQAFGRQLLETVQNQFRAALAEVDAGSLLAERYPTARELDAWFAAAAARTVPAATASSVQERLFIALPQGANGDRLSDAAQRCLSGSSIIASADHVVILRELEGIALTEAAAKITQSGETCAEAARRVLTRRDVAWTQLPMQIVELEF